MSGAHTLLPHPRLQSEDQQKALSLLPSSDHGAVLYPSVSAAPYGQPPEFAHRDSGYAGSPIDSEQHGSSQFVLPQSRSTAYRLSPTRPESDMVSPPFSTTSQVHGMPTSPYSASALLQQHQANQHAFFSNQARVHGIFQNLAIRGRDSPAASTSGGSSSSSSATPSSQGGSSSIFGSIRSDSSTSTSTSSLVQSPHPPVSPQDPDFSQTFYDPFRIKHRRRTSPPQLRVLEYHFDRNPKPDVALRRALSEQLDMTPREVQVWFQNRRAKVKKLREKAERDATVSGDGEGSKSPTPPSAPNALTAPPSQLPVPPPSRVPLAPHSGQAYRADAPIQAHHGGSNTMFSAPPTPYDRPYSGAPTSEPYQEHPSYPPPSVASAYPPHPAYSYPSPLPSTGQSATPSPPIDFPGRGPPMPADSAAPLPPPVPSYVDTAYNAQSSYRRMSLPAHTMYDVEAPPPPPASFEQAVSALPPPPPLQPPSALIHPTGGPPGSVYPDPIPSAMMHPHVEALDGGYALPGSGASSTLDGDSPPSSYGTGEASSAAWDPALAQLPYGALPPPRGAHYAVEGPVALGRRRSSAPGEMSFLPQPPHEPLLPYGPAVPPTAPFGGPLHLRMSSQPWSAAEYSHMPPPPVHEQAPPLYGGYPSAQLGVPPPGPFARRGSLASLAPISEQHDVIDGMDPGHLQQRPHSSGVGF